MSTTSRTERFQREAKSKIDQPKGDDKIQETDANDGGIRFSAEEEASLLHESDALKTTANKYFAESLYAEAIDTYAGALSTCPTYLYYQVAILYSNTAACHVKLASWKEAVKSASKAIELLDKLQAEEREADDAKAKEKLEEVDEEIISEGATKAEDTSVKGKKEFDIENLRVKVLLRRARARTEQGGWSSLQDAEEDYKTLSTMTLSSTDQALVQKQLSMLPPRIKAAQEKETSEMMGKLKELGNGILKPFGLSTENFQMVKDEQSGGYSMNFKK